jgi:hypothetical protein
MKRALTFLLMLFLLAGFVVTAGGAGSYTVPEPLKIVSGSTEGLSLPEELPPYVPVRSFSVDEDGSIHLELGDQVPRLKILEQNLLEGVESTIFTKKNASAAEAHMSGKENSVFTVRMIWPFGSMEYVRNYANWSGGLTFVGCSASEEADPAAFAPYTYAIRTLTFNEGGIPISETWQLENEKDRFSRVASYGMDGKLRSVSQTWESVKTGDYKFSTEIDSNGNLTALTAQDKKNHFFARSLRISESPDAAMLLSTESLDPAAFDDILLHDYPQLTRGLIDYGTVSDAAFGDEYIAMWDMNFNDLLDPQLLPEPSTMTDLPSTMTDLPEIPDEELTPIPADARIWSLNFGDLMKSQVYGFVTVDPLLVLQNGKAALNRDAKDVNGNAIKLKKNKVTSPVLELVTIE